MWKWKCQESGKLMEEKVRLMWPGQVWGSPKPPVQMSTQDGCMAPAHTKRWRCFRCHEVGWRRSPSRHRILTVWAGKSISDCLVQFQNMGLEIRGPEFEFWFHALLYDLGHVI